MSEITKFKLQLLARSFAKMERDLDTYNLTDRDLSLLDEGINLVGETLASMILLVKHTQREKSNETQSTQSEADQSTKH